MFLGELGVKGLRDIGGVIEMDDIPIPGTIGYTVSPVYVSQDGDIRTYYRTNIPKDVWNFPESRILKRELLKIIRPPVNSVIEGGLEEGTSCVCLQIIIPTALGEVDLYSSGI